MNVPELVAAANAGDRDARRTLEERFGSSRALAVYGTLAPGESNHHVVAPLGGVWTPGVVEGDLIAVGWGATFGFPAFWPRAGGPAVPVQVLTSPRLPEAWPRLDRFEGEEYRRVLVPVFLPGGDVTVANLYAAASPGPEVGDAAG